jgi:hypothetical protein
VPGPRRRRNREGWEAILSAVHTKFHATIWSATNYEVANLRTEADVDFSNATDQELRDQLDRVKRCLAGLVNAPLEGREGSKIAEMDQMVATIEFEVYRRNANWP